MGAAAGVVADTESGWMTELKVFGVADAQGNKFTTEASDDTTKAPSPDPPILADG